ncbi:MAG: NB-ARC domain-containing protein [Ktedonobacteraceae bacterium]
MSSLTPQQRVSPDPPKRKGFWSTWLPIGLVVLSIIGLLALGIFIILTQGVERGINTLTIISIVLGMVLSILTLLVNFFQWREQATTNVMIDTTTTVEQLPNHAGPVPQISGVVVTSHLATSPLPPATLLPLVEQDGNPPYIDWGEAPATEHFYGRQQQLALLRQWVRDQHCRMVVIQGLGGMGKTTLSKELTGQVCAQFDFVFWRSLQNAPPIEHVLETCIAFLSFNQHATPLPAHLDARIVVLIEYLRGRRCLLVLDNFEFVLQSGDRVGVYRAGYEGYGRLLELVGAGQHQSCLLVTSREKPRELARLEGSSQAIRVLELNGLELDETQEMLHGFGLNGSKEMWTRLINLYARNPLALKLISGPIREIFQGNIDAFLDEGEHLVGDVSQLVEQQFERASPLEQEILYWLAIEREKTSLDTLRANIVQSVAKRELLEALSSLRRRSLVEPGGAVIFFLQPVILEYVTNRLVTQFSEELSGGKSIELLYRYALLKAQAKDYVRASQVRFLLEPTANYLQSTLGQEESERSLKQILATMQSASARRPDYAAGNLLNLLIALHVDLRCYDFSHLTIKQAYLQDAQLTDVNLAYANLATSTFTETFGNILSLALDASGQLLAAGTANGKVELWRLPEGTPCLTLDIEGHDEWVRSVAFSPQGDLLASGNDDETVCLWDVASGQQLAALRAHSGRIYSVAFSPRNDLLASGGDEHVIHIWDTRTRQHVQKLQCQQGRVRSLAFSPQGDLLASGSEDNSISLWDMNAGVCKHILREHSDHVYSVAFSPDGKRLVSGSDDRTLRVWELSSGRSIQVLQGHSARVQSVAFSPDGRLLASGSMDQTVRVWDSESGRCIYALQEHSNRVRSVAFSPDSTLVVSGGDDQAVRVWEVDSGQCLKRLHGHTSCVYSVAFSPDGRTVVSDNEDCALHEWNVASGQGLRTFRKHTSWIYATTYSPDGRLLATGSDDQEIHLWDVKSGAWLRTLRHTSGRVRSVAFSPDSKLLVSGGDDQDILLWDCASGQRVDVLRGHSDRVRRVVFAPGTNQNTYSADIVLASGGDDETVRIWKRERTTREITCTHVLKGHSGRVWSLDFSPLNSNLLASGDERDIHLWDIQRELSTGILHGHSGRVYSIVFSPDGSLLASGSEDHTIRLWDTKSQQCIAILKGHSSRIRAVAFNNTGSLLASGSHDGTTRLWDINTQTCIHTLRTDRPYERMNITGIKGVTSAQKNMLKDLGAIEA